MAESPMTQARRALIGQALAYTQGAIDWTHQALMGQSFADFQRQQALEAQRVDPIYTQPQLGGPRVVPQEGVEAVPLGDPADPVGLVAGVVADPLRRGLAQVGQNLTTPALPLGFRRGSLLSERGNLGPVPRNAAGEALPESTIRDPEGTLKRLYHGTGAVYPDFDMARAGSGAGGDLYGPGIYMTDSPDVAATYAVRGGGIERQPVTQPGGWNAVYEELRRRDLTQHLDRELHMVKTGNHLANGLEEYQAVQLVPGPHNIRPVYADLKRPFDIAGQYSPDEVDAIAQVRPKRSMSGQEVYDYLTQTFHSKGNANDVLRQAGYDGITHQGGQVLGGPSHQVTIAFSPDQVYPAPAVESGY